MTLSTEKASLVRESALAHLSEDEDVLSSAYISGISQFEDDDDDNDPLLDWVF